MSAKYKSPSFLLPNEINTNTNPLNTDGNPATGTGINSLYSMEFNGSSDYIDLGANFYQVGSGDISISVWIKPQSQSGNNDIIAIGANAGSRIRLQRRGNNFGAYINNSAGSGSDLTGSTTITNGVWYHLALIKSGTTFTLYVNTTSEASGTFTGTFDSQEGIIGAYFGGSSNNINGQIDEVAVFNRALNTTEIAALYGGTSPNIYPSNLMATDLNPIAYYPLGEQAQMQGYLGNEASSEWQFPNGVLQDYVMDFDGSTDYIDAGSSAGVIGTDISTFSMWLKTSNTGGQTILSTRNQSTDDGWVVQITSTTVQFFNEKNNKMIYTTLSPTLSNGSWHNVVIIRGGSIATNAIYVDGNPINLTINTEDGTSPQSSSNLSIGSTITSSSTPGFFNGELSNIAIWNSNQSTNIANIYNNGSPQTTYTVTPQNWWKLNATSVYTPSAPNYTTALDFDGSSNVINISNNSAFNLGTSFTISGWFNFNYTNSLKGLISFDSVSTRGWFLYSQTGNTIKLYDGFASPPSGDFTLTSSYTNSGSWDNFIITYDGTNLVFYINGVQESTQAVSVNLQTNGNDGQIGNNQFNTGRYFNGKISNVAVYNSALTSSQVSTLFNFGTPETNISFSPTAWWKLDNTTTGIQDSSGNGNNGTNNGATDATTSVAVVPSWKIPSALPIPTINYTTALDFDGNTNYVTAGTTPYLNNVTEMSLSIWFNLNTAANNKGLISDYTYPTTGHFALLTKGVFGNTYSLRLYMNDNGAVYERNVSWSYPRPFTAGQWHNLVMTYANSTINFYIDGQSAASSSQQTTPSSFANSTATLNIGKYATLEWDGLISNAQIWTTELSSSDALSIYNNGQPSTTAFGSPVSWWKLDSTTITDSAGSNNGTNNGATQVTSDVYAETIPVNGVSTTLPSTALQQSDLQFDSPYSNYSLSFDGTGDYIDCTDNDMFSFGNGATDSPFSISAWIKMDDTSGFRIFNKYAGTTTEYSFGTGGAEKLQFFIFDGANTFFNRARLYNTILNTGQWYHVVATYSGVGGSNAQDGMKIYVDGVKVDDTTISAGAYTAMNNKTTPVYIGKLDTSYANGKIDETAIFNTELTSAQVLEIYNNGRPKDLTTFSGTAPISWWRLGENAYFDNNAITVPNSISGAPNGVGPGTVVNMLSADAPGTYANGVGSDLDILDRVGDAPLSTSNSQSYNMIPSDISPYVPQYVGNQIANNFSMNFDGTNYFTASSKFDFIQQTGIFSISTWIKMSDNTSATNQVIAGTNYTGSNVGWQLWIDNRSSQSPAVNKTLKFHLWNSSTNLLAIDQVITDNDWNLITITGDGTTIRAYKNGSLLSTTQSISGSTSSIAFSDLRIGANTVSSPSVFFNGQIDEVAIFDKALNAGQIFNDLYQPTATATATNKTADLVNNPNLPNPVAWYRMGD